MSRARHAHRLVFVALVLSPVVGCTLLVQPGIERTPEGPTATPAVEPHRVVKSEWTFQASRSEPVVGDGASLAVHIVKVGRDDPTLITVVYTLAPGPTATPAILPFDPALANVGTLRVEDRRTGKVRYLCIAIARDDQQVSLLNAEGA